MPFKSKTYRVLIASPSDLAEERQAATDLRSDAAHSPQRHWKPHSSHCGADV